MDPSKKIVYLTTTDNPYDPASDFRGWYDYDNTHGYNTCGKIARLAKTSPALSDYENAKIVERAIDDIIAVDFGGLYKKVVAYE